LATVTDRHLERAREWFKRHASERLNDSGGVVGYRIEWSGDVESDLAALLAEVEIPLQARCAALEAALVAARERCRDIFAGKVEDEALGDVVVALGAALSGSDSSPNPLLVRAAMIGLGTVGYGGDDDREMASAIAERVMLGEE
jgi:hypothetical protein